MSKKVLAALLAVCMVASLLFVPAAAATFNDVDEDHWASGAIERWAGYGVLNGKDAEAGIFDPSAPMTRAEFAKMLVEMLGLTAKSEATFDDVDPDAWYADVVSIAVKAGIISGRPGNKFDPTAPVTFEEAAVMMCRAFGLAQVTSGAEWAKESIEKLTSLGMIGEGADEHLQVGMDCDRAVVAALADAVVKEYVNEDREEPITGEVNGVVLVVKGAKVEIKDATVSAPIVVESAEVTLTGTKAEDVKVSGKDAAIVADEASTVASVTLAGEAPKADIKGEVASVTIAEETTGAVVDAPKADPDTIVNNSTEEATVNGETVEGKPAETTDPTEPEGPGSVNGNDGPEAPPREPTVKPDPDPTPAETHTHNWVEDTSKAVAATCTTEGSKFYNCTGEGECKIKTKTEKVAALGHEWATEANTDGKYPCTHDNCQEVKPDGHTCKTAADITSWTVKQEATCTATGLQVKVCDCGKVLASEVIPVKPHTEETITGVAATCVNKGLSDGKKCSVCGAVTKEQEELPIDADNHNLVADTASDKAATCTEAGVSGSQKCDRKGCTHKVAGSPVDALGHDWKNHDGKCARDGCDFECDHSAGYTEDTDVCKTCGKAKPATTEPDPDEPTSHTCTADIQTWVQGTNGHYHNCTTANCAVQAAKAESEKLDYEAHSSSVQKGSCTGDDTDGYKHTVVCSVCGKVMETNVTCNDATCTGRTPVDDGSR